MRMDPLWQWPLRIALVHIWTSVAMPAEDDVSANGTSVAMPVEASIGANGASEAILVEDGAGANGTSVAVPVEDGIGVRRAIRRRVGRR